MSGKYCLTAEGRLLLVDPKKGLMRKGPAKMFMPHVLEVHNGMVLGVSPNKDSAVVLQSSKTKTVKDKIKGIFSKSKR
jgi:hypothetical protein